MPTSHSLNTMVALLSLILAGCAALNRGAETGQISAAAAVVNRRVAAYNAHDIEAFLGTYTENVRIYVYPERLLGQGRERMRRIFGPQFARADGGVVVRQQSVLDNKVINVEDVTIAGGLERNIAIYTIENGLIAEVRLMEPGE